MNGPRILVVDDEPEIRRLLSEILGEEGYAVTVAGDGAEARSAWEQQSFDLVLLDIWMPDVDGISLLREWSAGGRLGCPVVMMSGHGTVDTAVEATRLGALDFIEKPLSMAKLLRAVERALEDGGRGLPQTRLLLPDTIAAIGRSRTIQALREEARRLAPHEAPLLITGETGSGRESFARFVHAEGPRRDGAFVSIAAAALSDETAEVQLLGSAAGAGLIEQAQGGVLFIHQLEDMCEAAQRVLAGALEQGSFTPPADSKAQPLDLRFISSAGPEFEAHHEHFRQDLFSSLDVLRMRIPPLRDYAEDVPELLRYYVDLMVDREHLHFRRFSVAAQNRLRNYPWPGNIRELRNLVQRLLTVGGPEEIGLAEIERELEAVTTLDEPLVKQDLLAMPLREAREHFERAYLQQQLILCQGKVGQLAKRVGMERTHLYRKLRSLGVDFRQVAADEQS